MVVDSVIYSIINSEIPELQGESKVSPQLADEEVEPPYLVYVKNNDFQEELPDGTLESFARAEFDLFLWTKKYIKGQELNNKVIDAFREAPDNVAGIQIERMTASPGSGDFETDSELKLSTIQLTIFYQK